ncbi:MAG TPA: hypothetical protein VHX37_16120 [Acidobacteriaceae bacterium]|nr:hypothetical protein [Acidobacteriaceae bacterium]
MRVLPSCALALLVAAGCGGNSNSPATSGTGTGSGAPSGTGGGTGSGSGSGSGSSTPANPAYVYVSTPSISGGPGNFITAYTAAPNGALAQVPGSPFTTTAQAGEIASDGNYLYVNMVANGTSSITSYSIGADGALTQAITTTPPTTTTPTTNGGWVTMAYFDGSGQTFYDDGNAFAVNSNGSLSLVGTVSHNDIVEDSLSFTSSDAFGYGADCAGGTANFYGFMRATTGALTYFDPKANLPAPPANNTEGTSYCPDGAAVSGTSAVIALQLGTSANSYQGTNQLAVYSIAADGTLSTTNTAATMPSLSVSGFALDYAFDPTGTWLAVGGQGGIQIFKLANGVLTQTGSLALSGGVSQLGWDQSGHLYTYGQDSGSLNVINVASGVPTQASGSPYALPVSSYLAVQPTS